MLILPRRPLPPRRVSGQVDAAGELRLDLSPTGSVPWVVSQVSIELADAPAGATAGLRLDGALVSPMIPNGDVAAGEPAVPVSPGDRLEVVWEGCTPGQTGSALVFAAELDE